MHAYSIYTRFAYAQVEHLRALARRGLRLIPENRPTVVRCALIDRCRERGFADHEVRRVGSASSVHS